MSAAAVVLSLLTLGFLGSAHCAGMCGGFPLALALAAPAARRAALARQLAFVAGKAATYALLGAAASLAARAVVAGGGASPAALAGWRAACAWATGGLLVVLGLASMGVRLPLRLRVPLGAARAAGRLWRTLASTPGVSGPFAGGLVVGLLPCGLSWSAFALASTASPPAAALGLFLFGIATAPALLVVGLGGAGLPPRMRRAAIRGIGPLLVLLGAVTALRGGVPGTAVSGPPCCSPEAPSAPDAEPGPRPGGGP